MAGAFQSDTFDGNAFDNAGGNSYNATTTDAPTTSEVVVRTGGFLRSPTDAPQTSESISRLFVGSRTATDAPTTSESAVQTTAILRTATDAPHTSEAITRSFSGARTTTDAPNTSESAVRIIAALRTTTDAPATSDAATAVPISGTHTLTLDSILRKTQSKSFTLDAWKRKVVTKSLTTDAVIGPSGFQTHPRTGPHTGYDRDRDHTLAHTFDRYLRGDTLQELLYDLDCRLTTMENSGRHAACRRVRLTLDAVIRRTGISQSMTLDAQIALLQSASLTLDARFAAALTLDAVIAPHRFTLDAVIAAAGIFISDSIAGAIDWGITTTPQSATVNTGSLTTEADDPSAVAGLRTGWAWFTLSSTTTVHLDTIGSQNDVLLYLFSGVPNSGTTVYDSADDNVTDGTNPYGFSEQVEDSLAAGTWYVCVASVGNISTTAKLTLYSL